MAEKISQLTAATSANYSDLIETSQSDGIGGWLTKKVTDYQLTQLIGSRDQIITTSTVLTNPCPNVIYVNFTTAGQSITLPVANGTNGHPAGKVIWFKVAPTNTENFDINISDGTTLLTAIGAGGNYNDYIISYSVNSNQNGTPIRLFVIANGDSYLPLSGGTLSGNLILEDVDAVGAFSGLDINKSESNSPAQINVYNSFPGSSATAEINTITEGASDAVFRSVINGGDLLTWGLDASDAAAFVLCNTNTLGGGNIFRVGQDAATLFYGTVTLNADATTGKQAVTYQQLNSTLTVSGTTHTLASTDALRNSVCTNVAGCTITVNTASLQDGESANFQSANAAGVVMFSAGTGTVYYCPALCNKLVTNGAATITRQGSDYYVHGDLTA
jgi:hypothetical protein